MARGFGGKFLLGGLAITAFAKAAISFPELASPGDALTRPEAATLAAVSSSQTDGATPATMIQSGAITRNAAAAQQCDTPEEVLQSLSRERELIDKQRDDLESRKSELSLAKEKLEVEKQALLELKAEIEDLLSRAKAAQTEDLDRLIAFYENMKPAEAARIMDDLDIEVTILVLAQMKPRTAAPILAKMSPVRARAVSKIILERSQLPGDQDLVGIRLK
jgi:flagellar motility protein MotE (MotC chaperone)